ncbi:serpin family protein [Anditalea andensis]|uniref:Proteinase inhibitor I4 serpin n=1 Tax=Anditalea andensis TaxID=1048983 RepID=A0A074KSK0_9BACT|nr:serpin family protein [Anditalea andensis]KEO71894.1 proteinase inhibitor I4 serpin [Anditalea andensis]
MTKHSCTGIASIFLAFACSQANVDEAPIEANLRSMAYYETTLAKSGSKFAIDLFHQLNDPEEPNQFYSPYSIHQVLSLAMNGNEGEVLEEYKKLLRYDGLSMTDGNKGAKELTEFLLHVDPKVKISIANGIWYREEYDLHVPFRDDAQYYYGSEVAPLNMENPASVNVINNWIEAKTNNLIKEMLDEIPQYPYDKVVMYLANAIYYKADWKYQFLTSKTQKKPFYPRKGSQVQVDMMDLDKPAAFKSYFENDLTYIEIPYSTGQYSMGILYNSAGNLDSVADILTFENLEKWKANSSESNFILKMPKFRLRHKQDNMSEDLAAMGLVQPFSYHPGNFTRLFDNPTDPLKISRVIHDALIEVDEKGAEAAAATVVEVVELTSMPSKPREVILDKPFIFFIQEAHSGAILFMGKLGDPSLL